MGKRSRPPKSEFSLDDSRESQQPDPVAPRPRPTKKRVEQQGPDELVALSEEPPSKVERDESPKRPRRILRRLSLAAAGVGALLTLAPTLLSVQPIRDFALSQLTSGKSLQVSVEQASLTWWNPIRLTNVKIVDEPSQSSALIHEIRSERSLGQLVLDWTQWGTWTLDGADVDVSVRPDGSNWEDVLARWPSDPDASPGALPSGRLTVHNATARIYRSDERGSSQVESIEAEIVLTGDRAKGIEFKATARDGGPPLVSTGDSIDLQGRVILAPSPAENDRAELQMACHQFSLHRLNAFAYRLGYPVRLAGQVDGRLSTQVLLGDRLAIQPLEVALQVQQLVAESSLWQNERIASQTTNVDLSLSLVESQLQITNGHLHTDWADVQCRGTVSTDQLTSLADGSLEAFGPDVVTQGRVNFASLAAQLPRTLALRQELEWQSGDLEWNLQQASADTGTRWQGKLVASNLAAAHRAQLIKWNDPLLAQFQVLQTEKDWEIEDARLESAFLVAHGKGRREQGQIQCRADLQRLSQELGQIVDWGQQQWSGRLKSDIQWATEDNAGWNATARIEAEQFQWRDGATVLWEEKNLLASATAKANVAQGRIEEILSATLQLEADRDQMSATLQAPVRVTDWQSDLWPVEAKVVGELATWQNRLRPFVDTAGWQARGELTAQAAIKASSKMLDVNQSQVQIRNLALTDGQRQWQEPAFQAQAQGRIDLTNQQWNCQRLTLASTSLSVRADQVAWPPTDGQPQSLIQFRGDLARLWQHAMPQATSRPQGQLSGKLQLIPTSADLQVSGATTVQDFRWETLTPSRQPGAPSQAIVVWQEPTIDARWDGRWQAAQQSLHLKQLQVKTPAAAIQLDGEISQWNGPLMSDLRGTTRVDLEQLSARLRPLYGDQIRLTGTMDRPFFARGPLLADAESLDTQTRLVSRETPPAVSWVSPALEAKAGLGWQTAHAFGFELGMASLDATLAEQTVRIDPMDLEVSGGKVHLAPQIRLQDPPTLTLPAERVIEKVRITPAMCQSWLKYVAPLVADATAAEGLFSADVRQANVPMLSPTAAEIEALVSIHSARIGPGPIAQEILAVVQQARTLLDPQRGASRFLAKDAAWVSFPEQQVPCRMHEGRVHHQNLTMMIGETTVRTEGWVGLDQQISLVAEIPVQDDWVADRRWLAGLRGQSLRIPIQGTMQHPQLDRSILQQLGGQAVRGAAEGLLKDEVQKQLNKFLPDLLPQ